MRKHYLDNIRWATVVIVVLYHVEYMYNAEGVNGPLGKITNLDVQYYDIFQYIVYPWIMMVLFMVSGISSRLQLEKYDHTTFLGDRTTKLLVPSTLGLIAFQFIQGYVSTTIVDGLADAPDLPWAFNMIIYILVGIGVLWYLHLLWIYCVILVPVRLIEKDRLWNLCRKAGLPVLLALVIPVYGAGQVLNAHTIVMYRLGLYLAVFLLGYFVLSHDEVIDVLKKWFPLMLAISLVLGTVFCVRYFGQNYADAPIYLTPLFIGYGYFACLAIIGGWAKYGDFSNKFTQWMNERSYGLYIFHYLGISSVALYIAKPGLLSPPLVYLLSVIAGFGGGYLLNAIISRIPWYRWAVLGIDEEKKK